MLWKVSLSQESFIRCLSPPGRLPFTGEEVDNEFTQLAPKSHNLSCSPSIPNHAKGKKIIILGRCREKGKAVPKTVKSHISRSARNLIL